MVLAYLVAFLVASTPLLASDWPAWRGPDGSGIADAALPESIDPSSPRWVIDLPGESTSTPIVIGSRIYLTTQVGIAPIAAARSDNGESTEAGKGDSVLQFLVLAFDRDSGQELWRYEMPSNGELEPVHPKHNLASPSPVSDGERVIVWFGTGQVASLDLDGKVEWQRHLGQEIQPFAIRWAHGSSPVLYRDLVLLLCDHESSPYLLALDKKTGRQIWRVDREEGSRSYATPFLIPHGDKDEHAVVISSSHRIDAYDPATGKLLWFADQPVRVPVATPVWSDGVLYSSRGYRSGPYLALRTDRSMGAGGAGDVTKTHTLWRVPTGAPYVASLLYYEGLLYLSTETGVLSAVDAETGKTVWKHRLGGNFSASPLAASGDPKRIVLANESGELFVVQAGRKYELIQKVEFPERILASPVLTDGRLLVRTDSKLYSF